MILLEQKQTENIHPEHTVSPASNATNALVKKADKETDEERKLIQLLRQQLQMMKNKIENFQLEIVTTLKPVIQNCCQELGMIELQQKQDNINFQNQITELKKEHILMGQMIVQSGQHTQELIGQVGGY